MVRKVSSLELDLVHNPGGVVLPPNQNDLEKDYKLELRRASGIESSNLICITIMSIKTLADHLII